MTRTIIFVKAPHAGFAKTRLIPALGEEGAARLAQRMLQHTLDSAIAAAIGPVELCVTPEIASPSWAGTEIPQAVEITEQGEGDLGERMARAAQRTLAKDSAALLIGTDCIEMSAKLLREAASALGCKDAVIYPVADGGYALLGLARFHASLFSGIAWSTETVASDTIKRIHALGWALETGALLHDVDEPDDLEYLPAGWL